MINYLKISGKLITFSLILLSLHSCYTYPYLYNYDKKNDLLSERKIAVMPCNLVSANKYIEIQRIRDSITEGVVGELKSNGFNVIYGKDINEALDSLKFNFENLYNPKTGIPDTTVINKFIKTSNDLVINKFGVKYVLYPYLLIVPAHVTNSVTCWHGRQYGFSFASVQGQVSALSLYIKIYDKDYTRIFDNAGGIQPLDKIYAYGARRISDEELLKDPKDLNKALSIVFKPLREEIEKSKK
jgi:hypothetical protein